MNFTVDWFAKAHESAWCSWLAPLLVARSPVRILEIGCFEGRATVWLLQNVVAMHPESSMVCVDPWAANGSEWDYEAAHDRFLRNVAETGLAERVTVRRATSADALPSMPGASFDFVYVDGDHGEEAAALDTREAMRLVKPDGIVAWDDVFFPTPGITPQVIAGIERGMLDAGVERKGCVIRVDACAVLFRGCLP